MSFNSTHTGLPISILGANGVQIGSNVSQFASIDNIAKQTETELLSYTVPADNILALERIEIGGTIFARYNLYYTPVGDPEVLIAVKRTYGKLADHFEFDTNDSAKQTFLAGEIVTLKVTHENGQHGDFEARLQGELVAS